MNLFKEFREDQIACLCRALENMRCALFIENFESVHNQTLTTDSDDHLSIKNDIARIKALVLYHEQKYGDFKEFLSCNRFSPEDHPILQKLWEEIHYIEMEQRRGGKKLDPVARYRVRKRNPYPSSIWDGDETSYCFKKSVRKTLKDFFNKQNKIPNQAQKQELVTQTGLTVTQVSNWFKNQRQRSRQCKLEANQFSSSSDLRNHNETGRNF